LSNFREQIIDYNEWIQILTSSNDYLYTGLHLMDSLMKDRRFSIIYYRDKPVLGFPILTSRIYGLKSLVLYIIGLPYLGFVVFDKKIFSDLDYYIELTSFLIKNTIVKEYGFVFIKNPPYLVDPRGFVWSNWYFRTEFTYLSYPNKLSINNLRKIRRREYRKALKERFVIDKMDFREYIKYYLELARIKGFYGRAGLELIELLSRNKEDKILIYVARSDKGIGAGESFLVDEHLNTCYRLFPFTTDYGRKTGASTYLLYHVLSEHLVNYPYIVMLGGLDLNIARFVQDFSHAIKPYYSLARFKNKLLNKLGGILLAIKGFTKY